MERIMSPRTVVPAGLFWAVHVIALPLLVVGYVLFVAKWMLYTRRSGASGTALATMFSRWLLHKVGSRPDAPCARVMRVLPSLSQTGFRLMSEPTVFAYRVTGYLPRQLRYPYQGVPTINEEPVARTTYFDLALERHLGEIDQFVILGAGFDTRSYRLPASTPVRCFEVDTPQTQPFKRASLARAGVDARRVTFVAADFAREDWFEKLTASGFDPGKRTFFLWEGVTMYLDRASVESTLRKIAGTAPRSAVAFDYFSTAHRESDSLYMTYALAMLRFIGEPLGSFSLDTRPPAREHAARFVASCGLTLEEHRSFGWETDGHQPEAGFVVATVGPNDR
jgi:methyltransferase (TIGR00027 family)